jgi:hypothetical protein
LPFRRIDDSTVVVDPARRLVHVLNETAGRLWELIEVPRTAVELVAALDAEYEAAPDELAQAVAECLAELVQKGMAQAVAPVSGKGA